MVDIHSHIIPEIDDGAKNIKMSLEMLRMAENDGTKFIAATSHYCTSYYENDYCDIRIKANKLNERAALEGLHIKVIPGQEIYIDHNTLSLLNSGILGGYGDTKYMLVELPMDRCPKDALNILYEIKIKGFVPILAHPERYVYIMKDPLEINKFVEEETLLQINTGSITGIFGKEVKKTSELLIKNGLCHFIASDAHSIGRRCTGLSKGIKIAEKYNPKIQDTLKQNSEALLNNRDISYVREKVKPKNFFISFFKKKY